MILKVFVFWRIGLLIVAYLGSLTFAKIANGSPGAIGEGKAFNYWLSWAQWDGGHYIEIIKNGYENVGNIAFMPLFPIFTKVSSIFFAGNYLVSGLFLSNFCFLLFLYTIFRFVAANYSKKLARDIIFIYILFPTSFFAVSFYAEGLYLLLASLAFLYYSKNKSVLMAIFASLSVVTRLVGTVIIFSLILGNIRQFIEDKKNTHIKNVFILLSLSLISVFFIFYYQLAPYNRNILSLISVQTFWGREIIDPITTFTSYVIPIIFYEKRPLMDYMDLAFTIIPLTFLIIYAKKLKTSLWIYSILSILIPASTDTLSGMPRYLLGSFGFFIVFGQYLQTKPKLKQGYFLVSLLLQIFLLIRFINGYWVS